MKGLQGSPHDRPTGHDRACDRLAVAVMRKALSDHDAAFFADGPDLRFWCDVAGLRVAAVVTLARRSLAAGAR